MRKYISIILTLALVLNTLPLNAQEIPAPVIQREDIEQYKLVNTTINKELNEITIDNPYARHEEFKQILDKRSKDEFKKLQKSGTYIQINQDYNIAFYKYIDKKEKYPNSKYFKEPYQLWKYALDVYYINATSYEAQQVGLKNYRDKARDHMRQIIGKRSQSKNFFEDTTIENKRAAMTEVPYLIAYYDVINKYYDEIRELKYRKKTCEEPQKYGIENADQDEDCQLAFAMADDYDLNSIQMGARRIGTFANIAAQEVENCLRNVLFNLQTPWIPFEEIDEFLESKQSLSSVDADGRVQTYPESTWQSCGMSKKELIQIIVDNTITREEAKKSLKKGLGGKILQGLNYASFSYWQEQADKTSDFESYITTNFGEEKLEDLKENGNLKQEMEIAERMAESYNAVLSAIATDLIAYGKIFYYNDFDIIGIDVDDSESRPVNASSRFARTWYRMATDRTNEDSPIAKFARGAILQAGGKSRTLQDNLFTKSMYEVKVKDNVKANVMVLGIAMDFIDPIEVLAPLKIVAEAKMLRLGAKYAPKTTRTVWNAGKNTKKAVEGIAKGVKDSKVGRGVKKATEPVKNLKKKTGQVITDAADDWSDYGKYYGASRPASKGTDVVTATKKADDVTDAAKAADNVADATTPAAKTTPKKTATDPEELGPKLEDEFNETLAKAGNTEPEATTPNSRKGCIGFNCDKTTSTTHVSASDTPTSQQYTRAGFKFYDDAPTTTPGSADNLPGTYRQPGFNPDNTATMPGNQTPYIGDKPSGVKDFTAKGNTGPQARGPEGPNASKNPYDVKNQAGGPDTPGTQPQNLADLNQNISNTPNQPTTLSEKEIRELAGNKNPRGRAAERWTKLNLEYGDVVKVEPIPGDKGSVRVTNSNGYTKEVSADSFKDWVNTDEFGIGLSPEKRKSIQGLDETFAFWDETKRLDKIFGKNMKLDELVAIGPRNVRRSLNRGCSTFEACKQLADYLVDMRKFSRTNQSELLAKFAQSTGSNNVDDMYKSLSDFFHHTNEKEAYNWLQESVNDKGIMDFLFNNGTVPDFSKLADNMLSKANTDDLAKILKSEVPDNFKSLQQVASADDWKGFVSSVRGKLEKRLSDATNLYNSSLDKAAEKAPELIRDIRNGTKKPHRITLRRAVGKQTADDIVDSYREIEKLTTALK